MLVAFALQSYVTQTHIHFDGHAVTGGLGFTSEFAKSIPAKASLPAHGDHDKYPPAEDPANCPICQEMVSVGHFVMPAAVPVLLPALPVSIIHIVTVQSVRLFAPSHIWQGRAPPRI